MNSKKDELGEVTYVVRAIRLFRPAHVASVKVTGEDDCSSAPSKVKRYPLRVVSAQFVSCTVTHDALDSRPAPLGPLFIVHVSLGVAVDVRVVVVLLFV